LAACRRGDVAVADDGNAADGPHDCGDAGQVDRAAEALLARAAMHENRGRARVFQDARQVRRRQILIIPAQAHFGGDGNFDGLDHAAHQRAVLSNSVIMAEPPPTRQTLRTGQPMLISTDATPMDSRYAAASRISSGTEPKSWTASGLVGGAGFDQLEGFGISFQERAGVDQVGGGEVQPADFAHDQAERQVGVTCQRRQKQIGLQLERADLHLPNEPQNQPKRRTGFYGPFAEVGPVRSPVRKCPA
jgi:hypothetical protein